MAAVEIVYRRQAAIGAFRPMPAEGERPGLAPAPADKAGFIAAFPRSPRIATLLAWGIVAFLERPPSLWL